MNGTYFPPKNHLVRIICYVIPQLCRYESLVKQLDIFVDSLTFLLVFLLCRDFFKFVDNRITNKQSSFGVFISFMLKCFNFTCNGLKVAFFYQKFFIFIGFIGLYFCHFLNFRLIDTLFKNGLNGINFFSECS